MPNNALGLRALTNLSSEMKTVDRQFKLAIRANLRAAVRTVSTPLVSQIRSAASWSTRIPSAVNPRISYNPRGASVKITVDHHRAPHARPLEEGTNNAFDETFINQHGGYKVVNGRRVAVRHAAYKEAIAAGASARILRHPVHAARNSKRYQNKANWVNQPTRPFFYPTIAEAEPGVDLVMEKAVDQIAKDAGFK